MLMTDLPVNDEFGTDDARVAKVAGAGSVFGCHSLEWREYKNQIGTLDYSSKFRFSPSERSYDPFGGRFVSCKLSLY
jgi:hypothetical protein